MDDAVRGDSRAALSRAQRKIEQWRKRSRPGARIPEDLWREAAELARVYGTYRTAQALRLNYYSLKKHAAAMAQSGERAAEFVEILPGGMPMVGPECTIEMEDGQGTKMRIRLQGGDLPDVAALTRVFRERRS